MCAAFGACHRVHLVDDHALHVDQGVAGRRGEHQEQRLRCGDQDVGWGGEQRAALSGRGVTGTDAHADLPDWGSVLLGDPGDPGKRGTQIAFDVNGEGFQRRDIEHPGALGVTRLMRHLVDRPEECGKGFTRPGRGDHQGVVAVGDGVPGLRLRSGGCGESAGEPVPGCRRETCQRVDVHPCSLPGGTPMPRVCVSVRRHAGRPGSSRTLVRVGLVNLGEIHPDVPGTAEHLVVPIRRRVDDQLR